MRGGSHKRRQSAPADAPQQLILRALVGSFFVCAALVSPALAQQPAPNSQHESGTVGLPRVNAAPFRALITRALRLREDGAINPGGDIFDFEVEADRADDGTLSNLQFTGLATVNGRWYDLAREFFSALSDSHILAFLRDARHLSMRIKSDPKDFLATLSFDAPTAERARQLADGYDLILHVAAANPRGANTAALLAGTQVSASGKQFTAKLEMSRERLGNLLSQSLAIP